MRRILLPAALLFLAFSLTAEDKPGTLEAVAEELLRESLAMNVVARVVSETEDIDWSTEIAKITIPGRAVTVSLDGDDARLKVRLTPYTGENDEYLLVAQSEIWLDGAYSSSMTSLPITFGEEVLYFPLGRGSDKTETNPVHVVMTITVVPYLSTLDEGEKSALFGILDDTATYEVPAEGS